MAGVPDLPMGRRRAADERILPCPSSSSTSSPPWTATPSAEGWPGWWGLEGPEYLGWLETQPERDAELLMGATTYRLMSQMAASAGMPVGAAVLRRRRTA